MTTAGDGPGAGAEQVTLSDGEVTLEASSFGARLHRLRVPSPDGPRDVVLGRPTPADHLAAGDYMGATVGRFANRIGRGHLVVDGRVHALSTNENGNTLHGGASGFDARVWQVESVGPAEVVFVLHSPDGDQGFPGALTARSAYRVRPDGLDLELSATCAAATVVSLTNHAYLNLAGAGSGTVDDHVLSVPADLWLPTHDDLVPTGEIRAVDGTPLDLRRPVRLGDVLRRRHPALAAARGVDHALLPRGEGLRVVAVVQAGGLRLVVESDAPSLQVYTGNFLDGSGAGNDAASYRQGDGLCLEPQALPDAPNHAAFGDTVLRPGRTYRRLIRWTFSRPGPGEGDGR